MTNPMISDEAVEAAAKLLWYSDSDLIETERPDWADAVSNRLWAGFVEDTRNTARELLEAAAPYMHAQKAVEAVLDISNVRMDSEHGDPAFVAGWEAALQEVQARIDEATNPYRSQA